MRKVKDDMTKLTLFILFFTLLNYATAVEFKNFALKNELADLAKNTTETDSAEGFSAMSSNPTKSELQKSVERKLLNLSSESTGANSPLYEKIAQALAGHYESIGKEQTGPLVLNHNMGGGVLNFSGFTWNKPFANFRLYVNRQLSPDLNDSWLVHDTFVVAIDATTLLSNLKEADLIEIAEEGIAAFAGVSFLREYKYTHVAKTFLEGLQSDYSKLFLAFTKFNPQSVLSLGPNQLLRQTDKFSFNAGGVVNIPTGGVLSGRAGVLVSTAYETETTIHLLGDTDFPKEGEFLRLGIQKSVDKSAQAHLSLQVDFYNLLKITLLSSELEYSYGLTNKTNLSFYEKDRKLLTLSSNHRNEFASLLKGKAEEVNNFKENIVSAEERINENLNSRFSALLFGSLKKKETEQVKIVKDGVEKIFFKHYAESVKFVQSLWSRLFGIVINKLFDWNPGVANAAESKKKLTIEFEYMKELGEAKVDSSEKFSVTLSSSYQASKTHRWWHGHYRRQAREHLKTMTNLDPKYEKMVNDRTLRGPLEVSSKITVLSMGLDHFNFIDENFAFEQFSQMCENRNENRERRCFRLLKRKYLSYMAYFHKYGISDLMRFKAFIGSYFKRIRDYKDLHVLFGAPNIFLSGEFSAQTNKGLPFTTYFKEGEFQGIGVIDSFIREGVSRAPANISSK